MSEIRYVHIEECARDRGYGSELMERWKQDMRSGGFWMVMTSTRVDETAQHFYGKPGYQDAGALVINITQYVAEENKVLLLLERCDEALVCVLSLIFSDFKMYQISSWSVWLLAVIILGIGHIGIHLEHKKNISG